MKKDYWLYFDQALNSDWCDYVVNYAQENYTPRDAVIGFDDIKHDANYRKSKVRWLDARSEKAIVDEIWYYANQANRNSFDLDLRYVNEIQFTEYIGNPDNPGKYDWHHDVDWAEGRAFHRKLSIVFQLTDPNEYEGGGFQFDNRLPQLPDEAFNKGSVIVFPSFHKHRITPVTSGLRHSLVTWVEGPHWR
jgi:PKHD-type hydroxylase